MRIDFSWTYRKENEPSPSFSLLSLTFSPSLPANLLQGIRCYLGVIVLTFLLLCGSIQITAVVKHVVCVCVWQAKRRRERQSLKCGGLVSAGDRSRSEVVMKTLTVHVGRETAATLHFPLYNCRQDSSVRNDVVAVSLLPLLAAIDVSECYM